MAINNLLIPKTLVINFTIIYFINYYNGVEGMMQTIGNQKIGKNKIF